MYNNVHGCQERQITFALGYLSGPFPTLLVRFKGVNSPVPTNYVILLAIGMPGIHPSSSRGLGSTIGPMKPMLTLPPHTPIGRLGPGNLHRIISSELPNHHGFALNNQWGRLPIPDHALRIRHLHLPAGGHVFEFSQVYISDPQKEKTMDSKEQHAESSNLWGHPFLYKTLTRKIY